MTGFNRLLSHLRRTGEQIDASSRPLTDDVRRDSTDGKHRLIRSTRVSPDQHFELRWLPRCCKKIKSRRVWFRELTESKVLQREWGVTAQRTEQTTLDTWLPLLASTPPASSRLCQVFHWTEAAHGQQRKDVWWELNFNKHPDKSFNLETNADCTLSHWIQMPYVNGSHSFYFFVQCERVIINTSKKLIL